MSFGTYVKGIDGLMAGATSAWLYDVNDKSAEVGADSYKLKSGDVVVFRFVSDWSNISQETLKETLDKFGTCKTEEPNGGKTEEPEPEGENGKPTVDPKPEDENGKPTVDPKPEGENGKPTVDPKPEGENGKPTVDPKPEGQDDKNRTTTA